MGEPLDAQGRRQLAHVIIQSTIFEYGIFIGKRGGDPDEIWRPQIDDIELLHKCIDMTDGLIDELRRVYGSISWYKLRQQLGLDSKW